MATFPLMSLTDIRTAAKQRSDNVNATFLSDDEWNSNINSSHGALYDILVQKFGNDYFVREPPYEFTTDGLSDKFDLPKDFFKLLGVDLKVNGGSPDGWLTLHPFNRGDRNRFIYPNVQVTFGIMSNMRYRLSANKLWLVPTPAAGQTVRLLYVPRVPYLTDTSGVITVVARTEPYAPLDAITINGVTFTYTDGTPGALEFTDIDSLATALATYFVTWGFTVNSTHITVVPDMPVCWYAVGKMVAVNPTVLNWSLVSDGFGGWLDYVIVDAARKAMIKGEEDPSALIQELAMLTQRIEQAAENRDIGFPATVTDSTRSGNSGGWGWGDLGEPT